MVDTNKATPSHSQLGEEEASKGKVNKLVLIQYLTKHAAKEMIVQVRVLVNEVRLQMNKDHMTATPHSTGITSTIPDSTGIM